jgi:hypothetical protein
MAERASAASRRVTISGVTLHIYELKDGLRVIDAAEIAALFQTWSNGAPLPQELEAAAQFIKGPWVPDG